MEKFYIDVVFLLWLVIDYRSMTLRGLLEYLKEKFEVDGTSARRLRNLETS